MEQQQTRKCTLSTGIVLLKYTGVSVLIYSTIILGEKRYRHRWLPCLTPVISHYLLHSLERIPLSRIIFVITLVAFLYIHLILALLGMYAVSLSLMKERLLYNLTFVCFLFFFFYVRGRLYFCLGLLVVWLISRVVALSSRVLRDVINKRLWWVS